MTLLLVFLFAMLGLGMSSRRFNLPVAFISILSVALVLILYYFPQRFMT